MDKWLILIAGFLSISFGTSIGYSSGVIHIALLHKYDQSPLLTAWVGSLFTSTFCLAAPLGSAVVNSLSCRACVMLGGVFNLIGFTLSCLIPNFYFLFISYGTLAGIGQSFVNIGTVVSIGYYFQRQRTLATGVILVGTGLGIVIFPPLIRLLIDYYGLDGAFLVLGGISFQTCVFGAFLRPHEAELERKQILSQQAQVGLRHLCSITNICNSVLEYLTLLTNPAFALMCCSILCWSSGINSCTLLLPNYYISTGSSSTEAAFLMSIFGIGSTLSRILTGMAAVEGGIDGKLVYFGSWGIVGVLTLCFPAMGEDFAGKVSYTFLIGLYSAGTFVLLSQIAVDIVGLGKFASALGMEMFVTGVGFLVGPIFSSRILAFGGFLHVFISLGCLFLLASVLGAVTILFIPRELQKKSTENGLQNESKIPEKEKFIPGTD